MGGWSGGVYTRFRNWVSDKANSINPQAALFDQEDDGFAAGLNNCVTKDGLNKPSSAMDWNGQNLTGVLNFANSGTVSLIGGKLTGSTAGNWVISAPSSGATLGVSGISGNDTAVFDSIHTGTNVGISTGSNIYVGSSTNLHIGTSSGATGSVSLATAATDRLTVSSAGVVQAVDDAGTFQTVGWRDIPINAQSANYTLVLADRGKMIVNNKAGSNMNLTIPPNSSVAFPLGTTIAGFNNVGANNISVQRGSGVSMFLAGDSTFTSSDRLVAPGGQFTIVQYSANTWIISGAGVS